MQVYNQKINTDLGFIKQLLLQESQVAIDDEHIRINALASLCSAQAGGICFCTQRKKKFLPQVRASVIITTPEIAREYSGQAQVVEHMDPELAFAELLQYFFEKKEVFDGIHPSAVIHADAQVSDQVKVGANVVIAAGVVIESGVVIEPGVSIGCNTVIRKDTKISANVSIYHDCIIGQACIIHSGACIGSDGFGYASQRPGWKKIQHIGRVILGNEVEVGANTCIDRGMLEDTEIHSGTKIDNLCHIAHNVTIGENSIIAACAGIAGSTNVGKNVMIGGGSGLNGQITIADNVKIGGATNIINNIEKPGFYIGVMPAQTQKSWARSAIAIRRASLKVVQQ